ncbi:hypothetical protein Fuma_05850 [Fuerstiella marisgermanici]|uniref:Uncharacterized protein n=1 Tax=Fuerstiella marisgermanici TaxID=1891926 RepID=A0A1P8WQ44_9PLAN|nr:hypothetical protein Fuma_05850 [Fuerstiella marisgermanici]
MVGADCCGSVRQSYRRASATRGRDVTSRRCSQIYSTSCEIIATTLPCSLIDRSTDPSRRDRPRTAEGLDLSRCSRRRAWKRLPVRHSSRGIMNPERFSVDSDALSSSHLPSVDLQPQSQAWCKVSLSVRHRSGVALGLTAQERNGNWPAPATTMGAVA